jgi:hypothetical protein
MGSFPFERPRSRPGVATDDLPLPATTSVKESASEESERRPDAGERPSNDEGLKSSHSGSSSPAVRDRLGEGEKGVASEFRGECWRWGSTATWEPREGRAALAVGAGGEGEREHNIRSYMVHIRSMN